MNDKNVYISSKQVRSTYNISDSTLRRLANANKIHVKRTPGGKRLYNVQTLFTDNEGHYHEQITRHKYVYCRVSSAKQINDLHRQEKYMASIYPNHVILSDIGSGINYNNKNFTKLLADTINGKVEELVIAHKDRLSRFNFQLLEKIFKLCNTKLIILDQDEHKSSEQELAEDILSIIHIFSCKEMGKRRYKNKTSNQDKKDKNESDKDANSDLE